MAGQRQCKITQPAKQIQQVVGFLRTHQFNDLTDHVAVNTEVYLGKIQRCKLHLHAVVIQFIHQPVRTVFRQRQDCLGMVALQQKSNAMLCLKLLQ